MISASIARCGMALTLTIAAIATSSLATSLAICFDSQLHVLHDVWRGLLAPVLQTFLHLDQALTQDRRAGQGQLAAGAVPSYRVRRGAKKAVSAVAVSMLIAALALAT